MDKPGQDIGMVGLGVMGRNLLLNMADHGCTVAGYDNDPAKVQALIAEGAGKKVQGAGTVEAFVALLRPPRAVMLLVPAGAPVDAVIDALLSRLQPGDLIIDGGNSHYKDTDRRGQRLAGLGLHFLGVGISGGESGARHGPSIMPGGPREAYERVRPIFEAIAAKVQDQPCVTYLGPGSCGHYVKMVHNGIEYGLMQLISETYDLMKRGLGLSNDELQATYARWNQGDLNSFLIEITALIFRQPDEQTGKLLIDFIRGAARQKGTGKWTSQDALDLQAPVPTIDVAVAVRDLSGREREREAVNKVLAGPSGKFRGQRDAFVEQIGRALYSALIITYAEGLTLLHDASVAYKYGLNLEEVARIWRGGCIIRAAVLQNIRAAYRAQPDLPTLLADPGLAKELMARQQDLRAVVATAAELGVPAPGLMTALACYDGYRSAWMPANLIQAQRDFFGAHTYERIDRPGTFHTHWNQE